MKKIPLSKDKVTFVDDEDFEWLVQHTWNAHKSDKTFYATRSFRKPEGGWGFSRMHRMILGVTDFRIQVDHRDGNGLNNQRINLRIATSAQNAANRGRHGEGSTKYKGVTKRNRDSKFCAQIKVSGKSTHLGYFDDPVEAARAYDKAALFHHGEFARLNFPLTEA